MWLEAAAPALSECESFMGSSGRQTIGSGGSRRREPQGLYRVRPRPARRQRRKSGGPQDRDDGDDRRRAAVPVCADTGRILSKPPAAPSQSP
jgi:hypothetical protein